MGDPAKRLKGVHRKNDPNQNHLVKIQDQFNQSFQLIQDIEKRESQPHPYHLIVGRKDALIINTNKDHQEALKRK